MRTVEKDVSQFGPERIAHPENKSNCCGCAACADVCPAHCITMATDDEGFCYPQVKRDICLNCGKCERVCPNLKVVSETSSDGGDKSRDVPEAYAAYNRDETIRMASSSGGIFTLLAERIIDQGGIVFGAAMRKDQRTVAHIGVETVQKLEKLRGSKYLQSDMQGVYPQIQTALRSGRKVLFSGTPCQVEALRTFLGKDDENLLCVDLICHGVPSAKVWQKYVSYQETRAGAPLRRTFFREKKKYGWKTYALSFDFSNDKVYEQIFSKDLFMQAFLRDVCLRPSCYACAFKKINRVSDITLADFWGIQNVLPDMDDDKGTSLVLIHSEKGKRFFESLQEKMYFCSVDVERSIQGNPSVLHSAAPHKTRTQFFEHLDNMPFDRLVRRCAKEPVTVKSSIILFLKKTSLFPLVKRLYRKLKNI